MLSGFDMSMCPDLAVPLPVMQHIVEIESGANPLAIGVVGARLARQPKNLEEAIATAKRLDAEGYDYSLGAAQINRRNLRRYGLGTYERAFDPCANLTAGAAILAECYGRAGQDWGKAFSCYYSGDFVTGYRDGYVQKVYASIEAEGSTGSGRSATASKASAATPLVAGAPSAGTPAYRIAIRSTSVDVANTASPVATSAVPESTAKAAPHRPDRASTPIAPAGAFVPIVRGPNDPAPSMAPPSSPVSAAATADNTHPPRVQRDGAFVF